MTCITCADWPDTDGPCPTPGCVTEPFRLDDLGIVPPFDDAPAPRRVWEQTTEDTDWEVAA